MSKTNYLLIDASILPEVYLKVLKAKNLMLSGEASSVSAAAQQAGISRSAFYKYKDKIFEYSEQGEDTATLQALLEDNAGVLSSVMSELYLAGANILSVHQSEPISGVARVSITVRLPSGTAAGSELAERIQQVDGVKSAEEIGR